MDKNERLNLDDFGQSRPKLSVDDIPAEKAVLTIGDVESVEMDDRKAIVLTFKEFPEKAHWLNKTQIRTLIEQLSDKPSEWVGKKIPLEKTKVQNPKTHERVTKLYVCDGEDWPKLLKGKR